ncbi:MAG: reverse transcriptase family protein [Paracoccaceae bacterium]
MREQPAFEKIHQFCLRNDVWPRPDLSSPVMVPIAAFSKLDIPQLATLSDLADFLLLPIERVDYLADVHNRHENHGDMAVNHYFYHLKKKPSGVRLLEAPKAQLKAVQRRILRGIIDKMPVHDDAFGFVKGRNCLDAAQRHVGEDVVVSFDIASFFSSIGAGRVFGLFRCLGYPHGVARVLTGLCTTATPARVLGRLLPPDRTSYRTPHLPQGSPVSPGLANQMVFRLDCRLSELADSLGAHYSRYADDMTFSGDRHIVHTINDAVPKIVTDEGFCLNPAKTRVQPFHVPQRVTGIGVNRHLNVDRAAFDRLKAVIHACAKPEDSRLAEAGFRAKLLGQIGWVEAVNPLRGAKLRRLLERSWHKRFEQ